MNPNLDSFVAKFNQDFRHFVEAFYYRNDTIDEACLYALRGEGKRIRPLLCTLTAQALDENANPLRPAIALEMIHTYSLIHDDLPCMDDDDLRRGRPTVHKQFNEATAVLAGDGLLTDAFSVITDPSLDLPTLPTKLQATLTAELAHAAGTRGMVNGQHLDLLYNLDNGDLGDLEKIHTLKTGNLLGASCAMGAIVSGVCNDTIKTWSKFGNLLGLAFQIVDDLIDTLEGTGKSQSKDQIAGKLTYRNLMSEEALLEKAKIVTEESLALLPDPDAVAQPQSLELIRELASKLLDRRC